MSLKKLDFTVNIPNNFRKKFIPNVVFDNYNVAIKTAMDFALEMAFGKGHHPSLAFGGDSEYERTPKEIFLDAFQGKLGEMGFYNFCIKFGIPLPRPNFEVMGEGKYEDKDFKLFDLIISVKSTKPYANNLLLECHKYDKKNGYYLHTVIGTENPIKYDYIFLTRVTDIDLKNAKNIDDIKNIINSTQIDIEITGYITYDIFREIIQNNNVIYKGMFGFGGTVKVDNYYCAATDLLHPENFIKIIKNKMENQEMQNQIPINSFS